MTPRHWYTGLLLGIFSLAIVLTVRACWEYEATPTPPASPLARPTKAVASLAPINLPLGVQVTVCKAETNVNGAIAYEGFRLLAVDGGYKAEPDQGKPWHVLPLGTEGTVVALTIGGWSNVALRDGRQLFIAVDRLCQIP